MDQVANDGLVADDLGVVLGIRGGRRSFPQFAEVAVAADVLDVLVRGQPLGEDDQVDRLTLVVEHTDAIVDLLMGVGVEVDIVLAEDLHHIADDDVVAQHAAQHAALGFAALRREAVGTVHFHCWHSAASSSRVVQRL